MYPMPCAYLFCFIFKHNYKNNTAKSSQCIGLLGLFTLSLAWVNICFVPCPDEKVMADDEFTCDLFRFLQLLCEGHNNG